MVPAKDIFHLPSEIPLEEGCIISDAVSTPYHAVKNRGQVRPGDWVVVIGCGGIGSNVVQNVKAAGGLPIAVDIVPEKLVSFVGKYLSFPYNIYISITVLYCNHVWRKTKCIKIKSIKKE